jgi:general secretion pathway protein A
MYFDFYGLRESPFDLTPNPRFLFLPARQREALSNLRYGLTAARGMSLLLGDAGTGKTTLVQTVLAEMNPENVQCVLLSNPTLTRAEFFEFLAGAFSLSDKAARSKTLFLAELRRYLTCRHERGLVTALLIDEAQSLPYELLEEVRLLGNIETPSTKLLNVILVGQPELGDRLNESRLRQLKQRISLRCDLEPFNVEETAAYIAGRLRIAGGVPEQIFTREAIAAMHPASQGLPRIINVACDNALLGGFAAQVKPVTRRIVDEVLRDFELLPAAAAAPVAATPVAEPSIPAPAPSAVEAPGPVMRGSLFGAVAEAPQASGFAAFGRKKWFSFF